MVRRVDVRGDGACFFRACAYLLYDDENDFMKVKDRIIRYLEKNPEYIQYCEVEPKTLSAYRDALYMQTYWGGYYEATIISFAYKRNVYIESRCIKNTIPIELQKSNRKPLYLYHTGNHYQAIVDDDESPDKSGDRSSDRSGDRSSDRTGDKSGDRTSYRSNDRTSDWHELREVHCERRDRTGSRPIKRRHLVPLIAIGAGALLLSAVNF